MNFYTKRAMAVGGTFQFEFLCAMSYAATKGAEIGECFQVLANIKDGNFESWIREWTKVGERNLEDAEKYLSRGLTSSATWAFHRASNYFRTAEMFANHSDPRQYELWKKSKAAFWEAAKHNDPEIIPLTIPYQSKQLPGYLIKAPGSKKTPTLIAHSGYDGSAEELYHMIGAVAPANGWNCLIFEGPGQRGALHLEPTLTLRHDWEVPVKAVVDFAQSLPGVDGDRLALIGYSLGGYLAPRACAFEPRIKACVASSLLTDIGAAFRSIYPRFVRNQKRAFNLFFKIAMRFWKEMAWGYEHGQWAIGPTTPLEFIEFWDSFNLEGLQDKIRCPVLNVLGEDEIKLTSDVVIQKIVDWLGGMNVQYHLFAKQSGGATHCQMGNISLAHAVIFEWLNATVIEGNPSYFPKLKDLSMQTVEAIRKGS